MIAQFILFAVFVLFVVLPIMFHYENEKLKKANTFEDHVADAMRITKPE